MALTGLARGWRLVGPLAVLALLALASGCAVFKPAAVEGAPAAKLAPPPIDLQVTAPPPLKAVLDKHLDLARLQQLRTEEAISGGELSRLIGAAPAQARELLQTEGYFDARVTVRREAPAGAVAAAAAPAAAASAADLPAAADSALDGPGQGGPVRVFVAVEPGAPALVTALEVSTEGALKQQADAGDAEAQALQQALPAASALQPGKVFRNAEWSASKQALLARLRAVGYASASIVDSRADVDVAAHSVALRVVLVSGPLYRAGPLVITGLAHHDEITVRNLAGFGVGAPLTEARMLDYQEQLQSARLFQSVSVTFEPYPLAAAATPVRVRVVELPLQQATLGVGVASNSGARVSVEHTHRRPFDWPVILYNKLEVGQKNQKWRGDLQSHPGPGFFRNLLGVQIERDFGDSDVVLSQRVRLGRTQDTKRTERLYFLELLQSRRDDLASVATVAGGGPTTATALSANAHFVWRRVDSLLLPTTGVTFALQTGAGVAVSHTGDNGPFSRLYGRLTGYLPLGGGWYSQARVEAGQVFHKTSVAVPDALGFRAGGEDSVRGYAYRELAPVDASGATISGNVLLTGSAELARPILASKPSVWGAVFIDAGRAATHWQTYKPALGYGVGVRWRSPIGPLKVDLAWADELKKFRLHLSVGVAL